MGASIDGKSPGLTDYFCRVTVGENRGVGGENSHLETSTCREDSHQERGEIGGRGGRLLLVKPVVSYYAVRKKEEAKERHVSK